MNTEEKKSIIIFSQCRIFFRFFFVHWNSLKQIRRGIKNVFNEKKIWTEYDVLFKMTLFFSSINAKNCLFFFVGIVITIIQHWTWTIVPIPFCLGKYTRLTHWWSVSEFKKQQQWQRIEIKKNKYHKRSMTIWIYEENVFAWKSIHYTTEPELFISIHSIFNPFKTVQ